MVPDPVGGRGAVGSGHPGRSAGFLPVGAGRGQTDAAAMAYPVEAVRRGLRGRQAGAPRPNPVTGKGPGMRVSMPSTAAHWESVLRGFYDFHLEAGTGPMVNPFPMSRHRRVGRAGAHRNPMDPSSASAADGTGPRSSAGPAVHPGPGFNELFARLGSHRDQALVAFWVSTGVRAAGVAGRDGGRCGSGSAVDYGAAEGHPGDATVAGVAGCVECGFGCIRRNCRAWCRPGGMSRCGGRCGNRSGRRLYDAARVMFTRGSGGLGRTGRCMICGTRRPTGMARDPEVSLCDVQWVLSKAPVDHPGGS